MVLGTIIFALHRRTNVEIVAVGLTSAPAADQSPLAPTMTGEPGAARTARTVASKDQFGPRRDRGPVSASSALAGIDVPRSKATTEPGPPQMAEVSQHKEQAAEKVSPTVGKGDVDTPIVSIAERGQVPESDDRTARGKGNWGDVVDPDRDSKFELEPRESRARIVVPGRTHILSAEIGRMNAPRILREVEGDFDVSVRVAGTSHPGGKATTTHYPPYHGAGLLIWQDHENYVRLEIAADLQHGKVRPYANFEYRKDGALAMSSGIINTDGSNHLRLKRRGAEIYASFGPDGLRWTSFSPLTADLKERLSVGVAAINSSTRPLSAEFEGLDVIERDEPIKRHR